MNTGRTHGSYGCARGTVDMVHGCGFSMTRDIDGAHIHVMAPPRLNTAVCSLRNGSFIKVKGSLQRNGNQYAMRAEHIAPIKHREHPTVTAADLPHGIDPTGGLGSVNYQRRLRDPQDPDEKGTA